MKDGNAVSAANEITLKAGGNSRFFVRSEELRRASRLRNSAFEFLFI